MAVFNVGRQLAHTTPDFPAQPVLSWRNAATPSLLSLAGIGVLLTTALAMVALVYGVQTQNALLIAITPFVAVVAWPVLKPFFKHTLEKKSRGSAQRAAMDQQMCAFLAVYAANNIPHTTKRTMCFAAWRWAKEGLVLDALSVHGVWLDIHQHFSNPTLPMSPPHKLPIGLCKQWRIRHKASLFLDWPTAHAKMAVLAELRRRGEATGNNTSQSPLTLEPAQPQAAGMAR